MLETKPVNLLMNPHIHLIDDQSKAIDSKSYRSLIVKLLYFTLTKPDISFAVEWLSQFMKKPRKVH